MLVQNRLQKNNISNGGEGKKGDWQTSFSRLVN